MSMTINSWMRLFATCGIAVALVLYTSACKQQHDFLVAKKMVAAQANYVYAYTAGSVAKETPIRVRFTNPLVASDKIGAPVENGVFTMTPQMAGKAIWEDDRTIRFLPTQAFESNRSYLGKVNLNKLFTNVPADAHVFEFDFRTRSLRLDVETDGIEPENANDPAVQQLTGTITASDPVRFYCRRYGS